MKFLLCSILALITGGSWLMAQDENGFIKKDFYSAMAGSEEQAVNKQLDLIKTAVFKEKKAYEGALLMKKAGMAKGAKSKLDLFKQGHRALEFELQQDSTNAEYRFLRLMIQEHAPAVLGYHRELETDKLFIKNNFKKLPVVVQEAVQHYSKTSRILKPADL